MATKNPPDPSKKFEIQVYKRRRNVRELRKTHVPFSGSPIQHPYDPKKILIVPDPYRTNPIYYEFKKSDISHMEELPKIADLDGETLNMVRIWVKTMSVGILCSPFLVGEMKST